MRTAKVTKKAASTPVMITFHHQRYTGTPPSRLLSSTLTKSAMTSPKVAAVTVRGETPAYQACIRSAVPTQWRSMREAIKKAASIPASIRDRVLVS